MAAKLNYFHFLIHQSVLPSVPEACGLRYLAFKIKFVESAIAFLQRFNIDAAPLRIDQLTGKKFTFFQDHDRLPLGFYH